MSRPMDTISKCAECPFLHEFDDPGVGPELGPECTSGPDWFLSIDPEDGIDPDCPQVGRTMQWRRKG